MVMVFFNLQFRPAMAGISGQAEVGAESVALSGGYTDDDDKGYEFTYTGAGGNKGGIQTSNQEMTRANHGLAMTCDCPIDSAKGGEAKDWRKSRPIRVIRGHQLMNMYSPRAGYRYDGIYKVVKVLFIRRLFSEFDLYVTCCHYATYLLLLLLFCISTGQRWERRDSGYGGTLCDEMTRRQLPGRPKLRYQCPQSQHLPTRRDPAPRDLRPLALTQ